MNSQVLDVNQFMPHGMCFLWEPPLLWLHVVSDSLIALAYFSIPLALLYFASLGGVRRFFSQEGPQLPFKGLLMLFGVFIMSCGLTHIMGIWTIWRPDYYLSGLLKAFTGVISVLTAVMLWPMVRQVTHLPNVYGLLEAKNTLEREIDQRKTMEQELRIRTEELTQTNEQLSRFNEVMVGRELKMMKLKQEVNDLCQALNRPVPYQAETV